MIDMTKQYTYNGRPIRIYADGSDTYGKYIHGALLEREQWTLCTFNESDLVEVWEPQEGELVYLWDDHSDHCIVGKYADAQYKHSFRLPNGDTGKTFKYVAPFTGTLPEAFKGLS